MAAVSLLFFEKFCHCYLIHARVCNFILIGFYLIWLAYSVWTVVEEIYEHRKTAIVCTALALALVVGAEALTLVHFWPLLTQIRQVVVASIYS